MIQATVKGFERFGDITPDIDRLVIEALKAAADTAASVAESSSTRKLEITVTGPEGSLDGFAAGITSKRTGKNGVRLAPIYDRGTLGQHRGKLQHRRRESWNVNRQGSTYTAHRHTIEPDEGIPAEHFFSRARAAGRKALLARLDRGI